MDPNDKDEDLVMVGDGVEEGDQPGVVMVTDDEGEAEELEAQDDQRVGAGEPEEDDDKTEARKKEGKTRRQRQKAARDRDQRELRFLRTRNETVERQLGEMGRRLDGMESAGIDTRIAQLDNAIRSADDVYAKAIDANEGKDAAEANRIRENLKEQRDYLQQAKEQGAVAPEQVQPDPVLIERVKDWHGRNDWYDFGRRDEDSAIAGAIDDMLIRDGYDPTSVEYYEELDKRIARRLPHLAQGKGRGNGADDYDDHLGGEEPAEPKSRGPKFRVGGRERPLKSNEVHISRERREAMEEAGVWEDPTLRKKYLAKYAEWDREHAND